MAPPTVRDVRYALVVVVGLAALGGGCSAGGQSDSDGARDIPAAEIRVPSDAEAEQAITRSSRFNVPSRRVRTISSCTSDDRSRTCSVDYDDTCGSLSVTREAGRLVVFLPRGVRYCIHSEGWSDESSP